MGANGTGKTTLLKILAGLRTPTTGTVVREGEVGFAPEDPTAGLFAETVKAELEFYPKNRGLDVAQHTDAAMTAMALSDLSERGPYSLSTGEQRRVSIASVLAGDPDVLALDEPTNGLDRADERHLAALLTDLDAAVVFSTHSADFAYAAADRVIVLAGGTVLQTGEATDILTSIDLLREAGIRPPGIVTWARANDLESFPADIEEAVGMQQVNQ